MSVSSAWAPMRNLAFALLQLTVFTVPWETLVTVTGMGTATRVLGLVTAAIGALAVLFRGQLRPPSLPLMLIALFLWWSSLTLFWGIDTASGTIVVMTYAQLLALVWLIWELAPLRRAQSCLMRADVFGAYVPLAMLFLEFTSGVTMLRHTAAGQDPN